jgi:hypothetical protein
VITILFAGLIMHNLCVPSCGRSKVDKILVDPKDFLSTVLPKKKGGGMAQRNKSTIEKGGDMLYTLYSPSQADALGG